MPLYVREFWTSFIPSISLFSFHLLPFCFPPVFVFLCEFAFKSIIKNLVFNMMHSKSPSIAKQITDYGFWLIEYSTIVLRERLWIIGWLLTIFFVRFEGPCQVATKNPIAHAHCTSSSLSYFFFSSPLFFFWSNMKCAHCI